MGVMYLGGYIFRGLWNKTPKTNILNKSLYLYENMTKFIANLPKFLNPQTFYGDAPSAQ